MSHRPSAFVPFVLDPAALDPALRIAGILGELFGKTASDPRLPTAEEWELLCHHLDLDPREATYADIEARLSQCSERTLRALEVLVGLRPALGLVVGS